MINRNILVGQRREIHNTLRAKYGLDPMKKRDNNCPDHLRMLEQIANRHGFEFREQYEYAGFVKLLTSNESSDTDAQPGALCLRNSRVIVLPERCHPIIEQTEMIEHEVVHAIQARRFPRMRVWRAEYEAYITTSSLVPFNARHFTRLLGYDILYSARMGFHMGNEAPYQIH